MRTSRPLSFRKTVRVCSIGSTDPTGHAGMFLDAGVFARLGGVEPSFVVAGVTAQNDRAVNGVLGVPPEAISRQLQSVWQQGAPQAVRIGLLPSAAACGAVTRFLRQLRSRPPIVIDPVMAASSGGRLARPTALPRLRDLMRMATLITPNAPEAAILARMPAVTTLAQAEMAAQRLRESYRAVLITGGHLRTGDRIVDVLAFGGDRMRLSSRRIDARLRGTGCRLSAAIAVSLARGDSLLDAVKYGRRFARAALSTSSHVVASRRAGVRARTV